MSHLNTVIDHVSSAANKAMKVASQVTGNNSKAGSQAESANNSTRKQLDINNPFTKILKAVHVLPESVQSFVLTQAFSRMVPYVGTTGLVYEKVTPNELIVSLENKRGVQNHIGSVHAVAVTLLAETATGFILGVNLPSDRILLVKSYEVNFYRPIKKGQIAAVATLTDEQRQYILDNPKGEMIIPCVIDDRESTSDRDPITVEMTWAWIPKSELKQRREGQSKAS